MSARRLLLWAVAASVGWTLPARADAEGPVYIDGGCRFEAPADWHGLQPRFSGECRRGAAEGLGVVRGYHNGRVERFYFGRFEAGRLREGVVERPDGYVAGRFDRGRLQPVEERQTVVAAFDTAQRAAHAMARHFQRGGNRASARFYEDKARALGEQLD